jgi:putative transposase
MIATGIAELSPVTGTQAACAALAVSRATHYRRTMGPRLGPPAPRPSSARALTELERTTVLDTLHADRFVDVAPGAVVATLLDEGTYLASERTMYRILASAHEVRERRNQLRHPAYERPELLATGPRELWSWDITKLRGPVKWTYFQLYVILDVFSRYVPGWMVATRESAELARRLIADTASNPLRRLPGSFRNGRALSQASRSAMAALASASEKKVLFRRAARIQRSARSTPTSTLALSRGFPDRAGITAQP